MLRDARALLRRRVATLEPGDAVARRIELEVEPFDAAATRRCYLNGVGRRLRRAGFVVPRSARAAASLTYAPGARRLDDDVARAVRARASRARRRHVLARRRARALGISRPHARANGPRAALGPRRDPRGARRAGAPAQGRSSTSTTRTRSCSRTRPSARRSASGRRSRLRWNGGRAVTEHASRRRRPGAVDAGGVRRPLRAQGARYHNLHPFHLRMDAGELTPRGAPALGREPLLLPEVHPAQGRRDPVQLPRGRDPARVDPADPRPRRHGEGDGGIESWLRLGEALGVDREEMRVRAARPPGVRYAVDAYVNFARRSRGSRRSRPRSPSSSARPRSRSGSRRSSATTRGSTPPGSSTSAPASCRRRATPSTRSTSPSSAAARASSRTPRSRRCASRPRCCGRSSTRSTAATRSRGGGGMTRPRLVTGARLHYDKVREEHMLLIPEGAVRLNPTAAEVLELCDGERSLDDIVGALARALRRRRPPRRRPGAGRRNGAERDGGRCRRLGRST